MLDTHRGVPIREKKQQEQQTGSRAASSCDFSTGGWWQLRRGDGVGQLSLARKYLLKQALSSFRQQSWVSRHGRNTTPRHPHNTAGGAQPPGVHQYMAPHLEWMLRLGYTQYTAQQGIKPLFREDCTIWATFAQSTSLPDEEWFPNPLPPPDIIICCIMRAAIIPPLPPPPPAPRMDPPIGGRPAATGAAGGDPVAETSLGGEGEGAGAAAAIEMRH